MDPLIDIRGLAKSFRLHNQGGLVLPVLDRVDLAVRAGECVVLAGPSGAGKSTLLRCIYGNYKPQAGSIRVRNGGRHAGRGSTCRRPITARSSSCAAARSVT
jgi:alpha-D-ribose 1-methylphosphonate 5-triphosphate synthase subunit PhnL